MKMTEFELRTLVALKLSVSKLNARELARIINCTHITALCGLRLLEASGKIQSTDSKSVKSRRFGLPNINSWITSYK